MNQTCHFCEKTGVVESARTKRSIDVRGEPIEVNFEVLRCSHCGEEFVDTKSERDPFAKAYRIYRKIHNMLQPEEITVLRKKYGMTQGELSRVLGWGAATLSRYENGSLQDKTHDRVLKLLEDPRNLLRLVIENPDAFMEHRRESLTHNLQALIRDENPIERCMEECFFHVKQSIFTGFNSFAIDNFFNALLYFCKGGRLKTVINKLLFYADFKHFKEYSISITGAQYVHLPYGPVPQYYEIYLGKIVNEGAIELHDVWYSDDAVGQLYTSMEEPLLTVFSDKELITLATVKEHFKDFGAKAISEFSHLEKGYIETSNGQPISYEYASSLQI
jgi:putative zinc finger/helix-turn-helix YgiT family protein